MSSELPVLYSFRRCPYAMRARMAIKASEVEVELREILLKDKPAEMLQASPKGTVPVLVLNNGQVIDESYDVMLWALQQHDPQGWLVDDLQQQTKELIHSNDGRFKQQLDHYKYAARFPEQSEAWYRDQALWFLQELDDLLRDSTFLLANQPTLADIALFPFMRQFAHVDKLWFDRSPYRSLQRWIDYFLSSSTFAAVMKKYPLWSKQHPVTLF
ncbi:MAG: glutathione S-transferase [Gammaproteobacteria bacterium]|nr:glutathione S-transferase [Gammaproteobacteria bacterium]